MMNPVARILILFPLLVGLSTSSQTNSDNSLADTLQWLTILSPCESSQLLGDVHRAAVRRLFART